MPYDEATARAQTDQVREDHGEWLRQGIHISCWGVDPTTGVLEIGVCSPVAEAEVPLRARYGADTHVYYADIVPVGDMAVR